MISITIAAVLLALLIGACISCLVYAIIDRQDEIRYQREAQKTVDRFDDFAKRNREHFLSIFKVE